MAHIIADRVGEYSTTTGTGVYDLNGGAIFGFSLFDDRMGNADTCYAVVVMGNEWEVGLYIFSPGTPDQLTRSVILASTNGDAAVNWGAGTKEIYLGFPAIALRGRKGADIASAGTLVLDNATGEVVDVTGTTTITAITLTEGRQVTVRFTGALTVTNGASLLLPGERSIVVAAGAFMTFRGYAAGVVRCTNYEPLAKGRFSAYNSAQDANVTGAGEVITIDFDTEIYDHGTVFGSDTYTAKAGGEHCLGGCVALQGMTIGTSVISVFLNTSNRQYQLIAQIAAAATQMLPFGAPFADMDVGDTSTVTVQVSGGTTVVDVYGGAAPTATFFMGGLVK